MVKNFKLEAILSIITDINCCELEEIFELASFVYGGRNIGDMGLSGIIDDLKEHILKIYPELTSIYYNRWSGINLDDWIMMQKIRFGSYLPIWTRSDKLKNTNIMKKKKENSNK